MKTAGIHHITAFAGAPQQNVDFYSGILGLRLVKKTVNFDAPEVYHLYFGDEAGHPGTAMTFFPYPSARTGRVGGGQVGYTTFAIPPGALPFWSARLKKFGVEVTNHERFGEMVLRFEDYDGLQLELVEREEGPQSTWSFGGVPVENAIKGFGGAVLLTTAPEQTLQTLQDVFGMERVGEGEFVRLRALGNLGNIIDVAAQPIARGMGGSGTVHHIAWRTADIAEQQRWQERVADAGFDVTQIRDRNYFTSIYFREAGGILFEIATDEPGFAVDEPLDKLGEKLMLPRWYERERERITAGLEPIEVRVLDLDLG